MKSDGSGLEISPFVNVFCVVCGMTVSHKETFRILCIIRYVCMYVGVHAHTCMLESRKLCLFQHMNSYSSDFSGNSLVSLNTRDNQ